MRWICIVAMVAVGSAEVYAQKPLPAPELKILTPQAKLTGPSVTTLTLAPGERVQLRAKVTGGQRWWCVFPDEYAPLRNATFTKGIDGCSYTVGARTGTWTVDETYQWKASGGVVTSQGTGELTSFTAPSTPGTVTITVVGTARWKLASVTDREVTDGPVTASIAVDVRGDATAMTREAALALVVEKFLAEIPAGPARDELLAHIGSPGFANNVKDLVGVDGYGTYACGAYQGHVLTLLDRLRLNGTDDERAAFEHWDYGPVQAYFGGHQAVALYPKGSDWTTEGIVLDPWPTQKPETYSIKDWKSRFSFGVGPSGVYEGQYPLTGGARYPDGSDGTLPPELVSVFRTLPKPERAKVAGMSPADRAAYLRGLSDERKGRVAVGTHSPVKLLVTAADGRRVGYAGEFVYEIPGTDVDLYPERDGSRGAVYFLPYGAYEVTVIGEGKGTFGVTVAVPRFGAGEPIVRYDGATVAPGETATFTLDPSQPARPAIAGVAPLPVAKTPGAIPAAGPSSAAERPATDKSGCKGCAASGGASVQWALLLALWIATNARRRTRRAPQRR